MSSNDDEFWYEEETIDNIRCVPISEIFNARHEKSMVVVVTICGESHILSEDQFKSLSSKRRRLLDA